jgi:hypothetical protein
LSDEDISRIYELWHVSEEERKQKRLDVRAVHVGIGHRHDLVIATLLYVEFIAYARADRGDDRLDLFVLEDLR